MINTLIGKVFGTKNERVVKSLMPKVTAINALEAQIQKLSDDELREVRPDVVCAGLLDRVDRLTRAYNDEVARRKPA